MALFKGYGKIQAELSTGHIITCTTMLSAEGSYREWHESGPCEWMYGWTESESDIDDTTIEVLYPDEFESDLDYLPGSKITKILKVIEEPDWEVVEYDIDDSEDAYDTWRDNNLEMLA